MSYPGDIRNCMKPTPHGLSIKELREVSKKMGIDTKDMSKTKICKEIEKILRQAEGQTPSKSSIKPGKRIQMKDYFGFLPSTDEGGKIGTVSKKVHQLQGKIGAGAFIRYLGSLEGFNELVKYHKEFKRVPYQEHGWYVWAYTQDAVDQALEALLKAENDYVDEQKKYKMGYESKQTRRTKRQPKEVPKPEEVVKPEIIVTAADFPTLAKSAIAKRPVGIWEKPLEVKSSNVVPVIGPDQPRYIPLSRGGEPLYMDNDLPPLGSESWDEEGLPPSEYDEELEEEPYFSQKY